MRLLRRCTLLLASVALLVPLAATPVSAAGSVLVDPAAGAELMRLTNADRVANHLPALAADATLVALATNRVFTCPSNSALRPAGRALDLASRGSFTHEILGCAKADGSGYTMLDILSEQFGYNTYRAENIGWNNYAADVSAQVVEQAFLASAGHRANILGNYDRFGCGSAVAKSGAHYYACLFSRGGPASVAPARDTTRPTISRLTGISSSLSRYRSHAFGATFADNAGLRGASLYIDNRYVASWTLSGRSASRTVTAAASRLRRGRHVVTWSVTDTSGNVTTRRVAITVR